MDIPTIQSHIDATSYWDARILDFQTAFFGDEAALYIDCDEETCWQIKFQGCYKVLYETDAYYRDFLPVKEMKKAQLGYYGQVITATDCEIQGFYDVRMDLFLISAEIVCKKIEVKKLEKKAVSFFWST